MTRIPFEEMRSVFRKAFMNAGMTEEKADTCARIHTESTRDGVTSHGINRVERFVEYLNQGLVDADAEPALELNLGAMETYNGNMGPGVLNAIFSMNRATEIAAQFGIGMVGLRNTTHWMRGGAYGWMAADKGFIALSWTNTESCMPPWRSKSEAVGNNPVVIAVPRKEGHIVFDMALSQFSYGRIWGAAAKKQMLPYPGGFDNEGNMTKDAAVISDTRRVLPIGLWKGSGLAIMLDSVAALVSGGLTTAGVDRNNKGSCGGCSQVFIAIDPRRINTPEEIDSILNDTIEHIRASVPAGPGEKAMYPGEQTMQKRRENTELGIPVDEDTWERIKELAK